MCGGFFMTWFYFSGCRWILPEIKPLGADWALMELLFPLTSNILDLQGSSCHNFSMVKILWKVSGIALNSPAPSPITLFDPEQHFFVAFLRVSATWSLIFVKIKFLDTSIKQQRRELSANHPGREKPSPLWQGGVRGESHQRSQRTQLVRGWITSEECSKESSEEAKMQTPHKLRACPSKQSSGRSAGGIGSSSWAQPRLPKVS